MKDKVLFILSIPPPFGGGEVVSKILYDHLKDDRFLFSIFSKKKYSKSRQANTNIYSFYYSLQFILFNFYRIIKKNPNAIYIGLPKGFPSFLRNAIVIGFATLLKKEVYGEIHGMSFPFIENSSIKRKILLNTLNKLVGIRVLSNSIKKYLNSIGYKGSIKVISNGIIKPDIYKIVRNNNSKLNLLYFGAISNQKGFKRVIKILSTLDPTIQKQIQLNVIGEWVHNHEKVECLNMIKDNGLDSRIIFLGKRIDEEKWKLVIKNQIMIHLSSFDGQPLTIIETMSLGIPTIATKVGAIPEMINDGQNGFLIDTNQDVMVIIKNLVGEKIDLSTLSKSTEDSYNNYYTQEIMVNNIKLMLEK